MEKRNLNDDFATYKEAYIKFKEIISRGSVIDLAIGVVIGGAFTGIVNSLVNDIIMPPIGYLLAGVDFTEMRFVMQRASEGVEEVTINYGNFIQQIISFLLIALVLFFVVKGINRLREVGKKEEKEAIEETKITEAELLEQILIEMRRGGPSPN